MCKAFGIVKLSNILQEGLEENIITNTGLLFFSALWQNDQRKQFKLRKAHFWLLILKGFQSIVLRKERKKGLCLWEHVVVAYSHGINQEKELDWNQDWLPVTF